MIAMARNLTLFLAAALLFAGAGCGSTEGSFGTTTSDSPQTSVAGDTAAKRFQNAPLGGRTAVESAIELSQKYASLSDQTVALREENQRLKTENESLQQQVASLDTRLKQAQKELNEANDLLIEMLSELNNWKSNILGFRGEMRDAAKAQLEALLKVLEILGGKAEAETITQKRESVPTSQLDTATEPNSPSTAPTGDANDGQ
jgi:chromosome condensin MukBEF ATPase and DNA-binding subunit MukB